MLIKMSKEIKGCEDGIHERTYEKGDTYDVAPDFGKICIKEKWAKKVKPEKAEKTQEELEAEEAEAEALKKKEAEEAELAELIKKEAEEAALKAAGGPDENKALDGPEENK